MGRGLKKLAKWGFGLLVLCLAGLYGFVRYDYSSAAGELESHVERAKELGLPLTPEDMRHAPLAPEDNAAPLYREMGALFAKEEKALTGEEARETMAAPYRESADGFTAALRVIDRLEPMLELAISASKRDGCDFERDWDLGPNLMFPELAHLKNAVKWLCIRGVLRARTGKFEEGLSDLLAATRIGAHVGEEKTLISGLVQIACDAITMRAINALASFHAKDEGRLAKLATAIRSLPETPRFEPFLKGEVFWGYWTSLNLDRYAKAYPAEEYEDDGHDNMGFMGLGVDRWRIFPPLVPTHMVEEAYASRSLQFWNEMISLYRAAKWDSIELSFELDQMARRYETSKRPCDALGAILFPVFAQAGTSFVKMNSNRQATLAVIEAIRYRNRTGAWPKDLKAIGFEIKDPYLDEPLKYRLDAAGIRIYSVHSDRKDDGGHYSYETSNPQGRDLVMAAYPIWKMNAPPPKNVAPSGPPPGSPIPE